jgi:hypothetical protein
MEIVHDVQSRAHEIGLITVNQTLSMTKNLQGIDFEHLKALQNGEVLFVTDDGKGVNDDEAATLDLQYNAVAEKQDEYQDYVDQLMEQWESKFNSVAAKQQDEAAKDYSEEMGKIMTVARRIMHGDIVPAQDEKKLMEFDKDLYMMAKNAGMMARLEKRKKYKSLWDDEEKKEREDPMEAADAEEAFAAGPEVVSVESVMEAATGEMESE